MYWVKKSFDLYSKTNHNLIIEIYSDHKLVETIKCKTYDTDKIEEFGLLKMRCRGYGLTLGDSPEDSELFYSIDINEWEKYKSKQLEFAMFK